MKQERKPISEMTKLLLVLFAIGLAIAVADRWEKRQETKEWKAFLERVE